MAYRNIQLLDLPIEIRKKIWSYALPPYECTVVLKTASSTGLSRNEPPPKLEVLEDVKLNGQVARVCRRVYEDVQPCLFAGKMFKVGSRPKDAYFILLCQIIHNRNRRMVKRLELDFSFSERKDLLVDLKHSVVEVFTQLEELVIRRVCRAREVYKFTKHTEDIILILEKGLPRLKRISHNNEGVDLRFTMARDDENDKDWVIDFRPSFKDRLEQTSWSR